MKLQSFRATLLLAIVYQFLFWHEKPGLNTLLFFLLSSSLLFLFNPGYLRVMAVKVSFLFTLTAGTMVVLFNSDISIISFWLLFFVFTGFMQQVQLRTVGHAFFTSSLGLISSPANFIDGMRPLSQQYAGIGFLWKVIRLSFIPLAILFLFFILYAFADPEFNFVATSFLDHFFNWVFRIFDYLSIPAILFFGTGLLISSAIVFNRNIRLLMKHESEQSDFLRRKKMKVPRQGIEFWELFFRRSLISLKNEYVRGLILLSLVNALLLVVNSVDIKMVWFEQDAILSAGSRSHAVHESTYILIFSILLAMAILVFFFRGNLNFLKNNIRLKQVAYFWIFQNLLLAVTTAIRNYYYIRDYGLAYRRIGVIFFFLFTVVALCALFLKIRDRKSFFYLYRFNGWLACIILVIMTCFNWDALIARYNLTHFSKEQIDRDFLMSLSDRALPVILQYKDVFIDEGHDDSETAVEHEWLNKRKNEFIESYEAASWPSWNYVDYKTYQMLTSQNFAL